MTPERAKWIVKNSLPQLMNKNFLSIEPPPNWELLANNLISTCYHEGDLCQKSVKKEVNNCLKTMIPLVIVQFGPWFGDNCQALNRGVVEQWGIKSKP